MRRPTVFRADVRCSTARVGQSGKRANENVPVEPHELVCSARIMGTAFGAKRLRVSDAKRFDPGWRRRPVLDRSTRRVGGMWVVFDEAEVLNY